MVAASSPQMLQANVVEPLLRAKSVLLSAASSPFASMEPFTMRV